jgi:hypothetical protein
VKRGRVATTKRDNAHNKRPRKEEMRPLQKIVNVSQPVVDRHLVDNNIPQYNSEKAIFHNLALKRDIGTRMLECQKSLMISYWGIMRHQPGYKKFPSTILVLEKCMIVVPQLSTYASQPSLLKISLSIQRPW